MKQAELTEGEYIDFDGAEVEDDSDVEVEASGSVDPYSNDERNMPGGAEVPEEKFNKWRGSQKIMACSDDCIKFIGDFGSGAYYSVLGSTVKYRGQGNGKRQQYLCLKPGHNCNDCPHTRRLDKYRQDHPHEAAPAAKTN